MKHKLTHTPIKNDIKSKLTKLVAQSVHSFPLEIELHLFQEEKTLIPSTFKLFYFEIREL